ncbi:hypothetical protein C8J56DRAFT_792873, partial [Mycena floridula]
TPRIYIYSRADKIVQAESVEEHIADVTRKNFDVAVERFSGSGHVVHAKADPERYWNIATSTWKRTVSRA